MLLSLLTIEPRASNKSLLVPWLLSKLGDTQLIFSYFSPSFSGLGFSVSILFIILYVALLFERDRAY